MTYDPEINTFHTGDTIGSSLRGMGQMFLYIDKNLAQFSDTPPEVIEDWKTLKSWLQLSDDDFTPEENERIGIAWQSYLAAGKAPVSSLEAAFLDFKKVSEEEGWETVYIPNNIKLIFDRMMATNADLVSKKQPEKNPPQASHSFSIERSTIAIKLIWLFFSFVIAVEISGGLLHTIIAVLGISSPAWLHSGMHWITSFKVLPTWTIAAACAAMIMAMMPVMLYEDYYYNFDDYAGVLILAMPLAFCVLRYLQNLQHSQSAFKK